MFFQVRLFLLLALFGYSFKTAAQSPLGTWTVIDDETGKETIQIEIYEQNGRQYGRVSKLIKSPNHVCVKCPGYRKNQHILNMVVIENMQLEDGVWQGGQLLHTHQGKWYNAKYWLEEGDPNTLVLRGYWGPLYRTQRWHRVR